MSKTATALFLTVLTLAGSALAAPGDTLKSIPAPYMCPQGLAYDGKYLWCVDRRSDQIYAVSRTDGAIQDSISTPGYVPRGLAFDGRLLWVADAEEERLFAINPSSKIVERTIPSPISEPTGLAWDGKRLWISGDGYNKIDLISIDDGTTIVSIPSPTSHTTSLSYDGAYLWVADRFADRIYMVAPVRGDVVMSYPSPGPYPCGLAWDGKNLWAVDYQTDRIYQLVRDDDTPYARTKVKKQKVDFLHQVRSFGPDTLKTLDVYMALPESFANQDLLSTVEFSPTVTDVLTDKWGQKVAHFRFDDLGPDQFTELRMTVSANMYETRFFVFPEKVGRLDEIPKAIRDEYLVDDTKFDIGSNTIRQAVQDAVGVETNPYWIARRIQQYCVDKLEYERVGGWNVAPAVLERGNGSCSEYTFVYIAMCRAAGLPARYAGAIVVRNDDASYDDVFHRWVEVYLPGYGWVPVDPSRGDSKWPADVAGSFGFVANNCLVTTVGGGGSEYMDWGYNGNERWTSKGKCKVVVENIGEWTPVE
ncbi:MAG: transglutaminase domain-containing protein [Candidatus Zixiibacteriota bacterium]